MKTTTASQKMRTYRLWIFSAASVLGMTVVCGTLAQPESSASNAATRPRRISLRPGPDARGNGIPSLRVGDGGGASSVRGDEEHSSAGAQGRALPQQLLLTLLI